MLKIGEFSKLAQMTVKALRFYEKEGLLIPASIDRWSGYRFYESGQLETAAKIRSFRQLDLSIEEIKSIFDGGDAKTVLVEKAAALNAQKKDIEFRLSVINHILEEQVMKYQVTVKEIPSSIVYYTEKRLAHISDIMDFIPACGEECMRLNPDIRCAVPAYEFVEYLDEEFREENVLIRHNEAVDRIGNENEMIRFRRIPDTKVLSLLHKGPYEQLYEAYAHILNYAESNGYKISGLIRECYIDGIWNKEDPTEWLTEIQLPIE